MRIITQTVAATASKWNSTFSPSIRTMWEKLNRPKYIDVRVDSDARDTIINDMDYSILILEGDDAVNIGGISARYAYDGSSNFKILPPGSSYTFTWPRLPLIIFL